MKVLHLPYSYFPDPTGGTEVYVADLVRELGRLGISSAIAYASAAEPGKYSWEGASVHRMQLPAPATLDELYGDQPSSVDAYLRVAEEVRPDVVHIHAYTPSLNGAVARALKAAGFPITTTYHTPTVTCQRGTLLLFGNTVCDGVMLVDRCSACVLQKHSVPRPAADLLGALPTVVGELLGHAGARRGAWAAPRMSALMRTRIRDTAHFLRAADLLVAPAEWVRAVLIANGVDAEKIVLSPQGISDRSTNVPSGHSDRSSVEPLRAVMLGRIDPTKGIGVLLQALALVPELPVRLDIFGAHDGTSGYHDSIRAAAASDQRVQLMAKIPHEDVPDRLAEYDVMLVPSQGLETGPLVVLEAQSVGLPVIGSRLGAITDHVEHDVNGLLVAPRSPAAWAAALQRVANDRGVLARLRAGARAPRSAREVAAQMADIYSRLTSRADRSAFA